MGLHRRENETRSSADSLIYGAGETSQSSFSRGIERLFTSSVVCDVWDINVIAGNHAIFFLLSLVDPLIASFKASLFLACFLFGGLTKFFFLSSDGTLRKVISEREVLQFFARQICDFMYIVLCHGVSSIFENSEISIFNL